MKMYRITLLLILSFAAILTSGNSHNLLAGGDGSQSRLSAGNGIRFARSDADLDQYDEQRLGNGLEEEELPIVDNERPAAARPYISPGGWATPPPNSDIDIGFTPVQTYLQVRRTNTVHRLPRSEAIKEASSLDEVLNAHRLKEVLRTKKIQEVYSEEGYEDSAYDHGNHERHAEHDEGYDHHKAGKYKVKDPVQHIHDIADSESQVIEKNSKPRANKPKFSRKRVESTSMKFAYMTDGSKKRSEDNERGTQNTNQSKKFKRAPKGTTREAKKEKPAVAVKRDFVSTKEDFWNFPSGFEDLSVNKWGANFEPMSRRKEKSEESKKKVRIPPVPTFGYIHSLTDAHYGNQAPMTYVQPKPIPSHVINLTETFRPPSAQAATFEPRRIRKRIKRSADEGKLDTEKYEKELKQNLDEQEKNIINSALKHLNILNGFNDKHPLLGHPSHTVLKPNVRHRQVGFDAQKYPYFYSQGLDSHSPLRYASHPREFPIKSGYGMEFYDEKDRAVECEEINVNLDDAPKENSTRHLTEQPGEKKRIVGLGDKIQCLKIKYFGEDPLDSPFFKEDELKKVSITARPNETFKFHSSYQYQPNQSMDIFVKEKLNDSSVESTEELVKYQVVHPESTREEKNQLQEHRHHQLQELQENFTEDFRVIPVRENSIELTTSAPIRGMRPPPVMFTHLPFTVVRVPRRQKPAKLMRTIKFNDNCLQPVTRMTISERSDEDVMYDCLDAKLLQTTLNGNTHFKIMPKRKVRRSELMNIFSDDLMDFRAGEVFESGDLLASRPKRSTPPSPRRKSSLFPNKSLLDKLVKRPVYESKKNGTQPGLSQPVIDLGVESPDELAEYKEIPTTKKIKLVNSVTEVSTSTTTTSPSTTTEGVKFEPRPLKRLSGRDFLVRYHKTKSPKAAKPMTKNEFWKLSENKSSTASQHSDEKETQRERPSEEPRIKFQPKNYRLPSVKREERSHMNITGGEGIDRSLNVEQEEPEPTPVLLYIVDESTGRGQWISKQTSSAETTETTSKKPTDRQVKKQNARKMFFNKKLNKDLQ